ncbi:hypothetical protein HYH03_011893 [Edaphochlamys debaryana]|uniref:S1 motif domain-containing protein n=1 Tax=Edaphochlamys debaryana TaxID=47281 RepID=A0A836BW03_9CHLO|nr:hypothetical protein HYH03_011893 [Edaphochlamys debaryana]|eukprot:KAG2489613.1 hypothetical protein HYH03_011893 [Edaphochlamys debaryana]
MLMLSSTKLATTRSAGCRPARACVAQTRSRLTARVLTPSVLPRIVARASGTEAAVTTAHEERPAVLTKANLLLIRSQSLREACKQLELPADGEKNKVIGRLIAAGAKAAAILEPQVEAMRAEARERIAAAPVKVGHVVEGVVESIKKYGTFLKVGAVTVFIHKSEISGEPVDGSERIFKKGAAAKALVISVDPDTGRVGASTKQIEPTPGDMLRNPQLVYAKAEESAEKWRQKQAQ